MKSATFQDDKSGSDCARPHDHSVIDGRCRELQQELANVSEELEEYKTQNCVLRDRIALSASIDRWLREIGIESCPNALREIGSVGPAHIEEKAKALWNSDQDCEFSNQDSNFDQVCHIFHQEWFGIRAAAGNLPGQKLAISASSTWTVRELKEIVERLVELSVKAVVIHGMSVAMKLLVETIKDLGFADLYLVWHGNTTQWVNRDELELASLALELNRKGVFSGVHAIRRGMHELLGKNAFVPQLLNMPPLVSRQVLLPRMIESVTVLCPSWNDLRKNLYTNVLAGVLSKDVSQVLVFAKNMNFPALLGTKVSVLPHRTQAATIELMSTVDLVSNVTVIDCHPMVNLEALAVGTPTLEGPLFLDALEGHPYKKLVRVENALSVDDVKWAMGQVISVPKQELNQMMEDYRGQLTEVSRQRYLQFLEGSL